MKEKEEKLIKTRECAECKHLFECPGKPPSVKRCINLEEVKNHDTSR